MKRLKQIIKHVVFLGLLAGLGFLYSFSSHRNQQKKVTEVVIEFEEGSNHFLTHKTVDKLLIQNQKTPQNKAKSVIDLYGLEKKVLSNPYVEKASVFLTIEGALKLKVKQRTPIVRIVTKKASYYIDEQWVRVPLSAVYSARVLLITGLENEGDVAKVKPLVQVVLSDAFLQKEIVGIHKSAVGEYQFSVRSGKYKIEFGKSEMIATKFKKLKAFYNNAFLDKTIENYKTINVKYRNQVVCTK